MAASKKSLLLICSSMKGHVVHFARLCEFFLRDPDEYELHVMCTPEAEKDLPQGIVFHAFSDGLTLPLCEAAFGAACMGKTEMEAMAITFTNLLPFVPKLLLSQEEAAALLRKLRPSVVVYEHHFNLANVLHSVCVDVGIPDLSLVPMCRPDTPLQPLNLLRMLFCYPGPTKGVIKALFTIPRDMGKVLGCKILPERHAPIQIFPGAQALVEVPPTPKQLYTGPFLPLPPAGGTASAPLVKLQGEDPELTAWAEVQRKAGLPIIYVALGTLAQPHAGTLENVVEALDEGPWAVIWALPEKHQRMLPKKLSGRWYVHRFLPQATLFQAKLVQCFVSHCGGSSTTEALLHGLPMVCLPYFGDQHEWAASITKYLRAGVLINKFRSTPLDIRKAVEAVLADPSYAERAAAVAARMTEDAKAILGHLGLEELDCHSERVGVPVAAAVIRRRLAGEDPVEVLPGHLRGRARRLFGPCCK